MKRSLAVSALLITLLATTSAFAANPKGGLSLPIGGNFTDATGGVGHFNGTFFLRDFATENNALVARGILSGTMTTSTGAVLGSVWKSVSIPVTSINGTPTARSGLTRSSSSIGDIHANVTCDIHTLVRGPLHLDLLGLTVDLNQVVLDIAAQTGAGNLLGNLLCAVTNLLNGVGSLLDIANLLNQILQILTGILG